MVSAGNFPPVFSANSSSTAAGIYSQMQDQIRQAQSGIRPDGTLMTEGERQQTMATLQQNTSLAVNQALTPIFAQTQQVIAQLGMGVAQMRQNQAQGFQGAAGLAYQGEQGAANMRMQGQVGGAQVEQQAQQQAYNYRNTAANLSQAATLQSLNLEMQGRTALADMVRQNPEGQVGIFQGMMALSQYTQAQNQISGRYGGGGMNWNQGQQQGQQQGGGFNPFGMNSGSFASRGGEGELTQWQNNGAGHAPGYGRQA
jgi:hypothetical protein